MSVAFLVGLVGVRAQYVAATSNRTQLVAPRPHRTVVADNSEVSVGNLYDDLYAPAGPHDWCQMGGPSTTGTFNVNNLYGASLGTDGCQNPPESDTLSLGASDPWAPSENMTCAAVQGPAGDADIDPSGEALQCTQPAGEATEDLSAPGEQAGGDQQWSLWANLIGTGGSIGNFLSFTIAGTAPNFTSLTVNATSGASVTLDPIPAFTLATGWIEISGYQSTGSAWCFDVDGTQDCSNASFPYGGNLYFTSVRAYWGVGYWTNNADTLDLPPTWSDFGALGCPGLSSGCSPLSDNGVQVVPADCSDVGTVSVAGSECTWANLPAYWFARIGSISAEYQQPLDRGPITAAEEPWGNGCLACSEAKQSATHQVASHPVNPEFGDMDESATDISIPGLGISLTVTRTYDSLNAATDNPFGYGWTSNLFMSLSQLGGTGPVTITQEGGAQVVFDQNGTSYAPAAPRDIATLIQNANGTWTFTRQAQNTYTFSSTGQLIAESDPDGYTTTLSYSGSDQLTAVTDPEGRTLEIGWTGSNLTTVTDPNVSPARAVTYEYDSAGDLTDVIDVNGGDTHYVYNSSHQMTHMYDPNCYSAGSACNGGNGVVTAYDSSGLVASQQDQLGRPTQFAYTGDPTSVLALDGTTTITDPAGDVTVDTYEYGVLIQQTVGYGTPQAASTSWTYDPATAAVTSETDPNGGTTNYTVDSSGNVLSTIDPLGRQTSATYNGFNEPLTSGDGNGVTTTKTYDSHGNLLTVSTPLLNAQGGTVATQVTTYCYYGETSCGAPSGPAGEVYSITDPDTYATTYTYDAYGDVATVTSPAPVTDITTTCDNADGWRVASYTPKAGSISCGTASAHETKFSYIQPNGDVDGFGDVQTVTAPSGITADTYDADRNVMSTKDADNNTTRYVYDLANEQTEVEPASGGNQYTYYTLDGKVWYQKDGNGNRVITYGYNALNQVTSETDALTKVTGFTYDGDGNEVTETAPGGTCPSTGCTTMTYDADDELTSVTYSDGVTPDVTSIGHDADGQRTAMTDGTGTSSWTWNSLHDMISYTDGAGAEVQYQDNLDGLVTQITYPGNLNVTEGYNHADQWTSTQD